MFEQIWISVEAGIFMAKNKKNMITQHSDYQRYLQALNAMNSQLTANKAMQIIIKEVNPKIDKKLSIWGAKDPHIRASILNDVLLEIIKISNDSSFRLTCPLFFFMSKIAFNKFQETLRTDKRNVCKPQMNEPEIKQTEGTVSDSMFREKRYRLFKRYISKLSHTDQLLLELKCKGYSIKEMQKVIPEQLKDDAIRQRICRAILKLKGWIISDSEFDELH